MYAIMNMMLVAGSVAIGDFFFNDGLVVSTTLQELSQHL